jgi:hypothetical protein
MHKIMAVPLFPLNGLKKEIGLLINFGPSGVEVKRKYRHAVDKV